MRYRIQLTKEEVDELKAIINKGKHSSKTFRAACILLNCDVGLHTDDIVTNEQISKVLHISMRAIDCVKKQFL